MKILAVSNLYPPDVIGGYELGCRQAVDALRARGHDVRVLTSAPRSPVETPPHVTRALKLTDLWDHYSRSQSAEVTLWLMESEAFRVNAANAHVLMSAIDDFRPDVVYLWMLAGLGGLGLLGCLHHLRVPWVWHLMDDVPLKLCTVRNQVEPRLAAEFSRQIRGSYLACSRQLVDAIERGGCALAGEVGVVPNWVTGTPRPPRREFYEGGTLRIVAAAAVIERQTDKGIDVLIRAAALLRNLRGEGFTLDVYGKVNDPAFDDLIRSLGLSGVVTLKGMLTQKDLIEAYGRYDVFAFPGRKDEPFAFAPLEALTRGCVPVMNRAGGTAEWLVHGVHCLKTARSPEGFAEAFRQVLDGEVALGPLARRGEAAVWRDYHLDAVVPRIEAALARTAGRSRVGAGTTAEAYRLAVLAEKLSAVLVQAPYCA